MACLLLGGSFLRPLNVCAVVCPPNPAQLLPPPRVPTHVCVCPRTRAQIQLPPATFLPRCPQGFTAATHSTEAQGTPTGTQRNPPAPCDTTVPHRDQKTSLISDLFSRLRPL